MDRIVVSSSSSRDSLLSTHKVLRNTYFLLALTLAFSALTATASTVLMLPAPGLLLMLVGFYGLMFLTYRLADRPAGILAVFALTGFMGYTLGPILSSFIASGAGDLIMLALGGTAAVFFCCSAYVLTTRKDMSFLSGMMMAGFVILLVAVIANLFLQIPALSLAIAPCLFCSPPAPFCGKPATSFMAAKLTTSEPPLACMFLCTTCLSAC